MARVVSALAAGQPVMARGPSLLAERALVLNVTYQALSIVAARRAVLMVLGGRAEVLHAGDGVVRSERLRMPVPSVVRLSHHVRAPFRRRAPLHRAAIFVRDGNRCQYCGRTAECVDHVHPRSKGGTYDWENVVACCRACNVAKGDSLLGESRFSLSRPPYAPEPLAVDAALRSHMPSEWQDYLPSLRPLGR